MRRQRSLRSVPTSVFLMLAVGLSLQVLYQTWVLQSPAKEENLPPAPDTSVLTVLSLGDSITLSKLTMLWLQAFDNQPGVSLPLAQLDYDHLEAWLSRIVALDPKGQYPLLAASRIYAEVNHPAKQRQMMEFVYHQYFQDPTRRWPWLAQVAVSAKHRLKDLSLALKYAQAIADNENGKAIPHWAKQMDVFILEEMGEYESAQLLIGGLLTSGTIVDKHEIHFLEQQLSKMEAKHRLQQNSEVDQ